MNFRLSRRSFSNKDNLMNKTLNTEKRLLKVLHVGVANRGQWPLNYCTPEIGFVSTALSDVNAQALEIARQKKGLESSACFGNLDEAIEKADVDCAIVCTPTVFHVPIGLKMIEAGIPVLIEKGMAPDWKEANRLVSAVQAKKGIVCIAQNYRYNPVEKTVWRAIHDESFSAYVGEVHQVTYSEQRVRPFPNTLNYPFASVWDMSCHHFDNLQYWLGPVAELTAFSWGAKWSAYQHPNNTSAHIVHKNGIQVHYLHTHDAARNSLELEVHGERGVIFLKDGKLWFSERPKEQFGYRALTEVLRENSQNEMDLLKDFHRSIVEKAEPGISAQNNLQTMAMCEMVVRSITRKKTIRREELEAAA